VLVSWGLLALNTLAVLIVGIVVLDLGIQATQILNQSAIYRLRPEARSRLTTAYLTAYFAGAVSGSAGASLAWERGGWNAVCGAGGAVAAAGLLLSLRRS
jgi:predicted MFS family arabinose efflux permease